MRARSVLSQALDTEAYTDRWGTRCDVFDLPGLDKRAYLNPSADGTLSFFVVPADTLTLARVFYRRPKAVAGVRRLAREEGWRVKHSFHFGHMETGYAWTTGDIDVERYLDLWTEEIDRAGVIDRPDWGDYFEWLVSMRVARPDDRREFDRHFTHTRRKTATPRPGIKVARRWSLTDAEALDRTGQLAPQIRAAHDRIIDLLGT
jgi:hypothetical protein